MRQMVGFDDQSTGRGTFGREFRCKTELQWKTNKKSYMTYQMVATVVTLNDLD